VLKVVSDATIFGAADGAVELTVTGVLVHTHIYGTMELQLKILTDCQPALTALL